MKEWTRIWEQIREELQKSFGGKKRGITIYMLVLTAVLLIVILSNPVGKFFFSLLGYILACVFFFGVVAFTNLYVLQGALQDVINEEKNKPESSDVKEGKKENPVEATETDAKTSEKVVEATQNEEKAIFETEKFEMSDAVEEIEESEDAYLLDTTAFYVVQEILKAQELNFSEFDKIRCTELSKEQEQLIDAISSMKCYITPDILNEVRTAEQSGKLMHGTTFFAETYCEKVESAKTIECEKMTKPMDYEEVKYKAKYYLLVWEAMQMQLNPKYSKVYLATAGGRIQCLAYRNNVDVLDLSN